MPIISPSSLHQLLKCPFCHRTLLAPTTLQCAHTLCSTHISSVAACPIPSCPNPSSSSSTIPGVAFIPPPLPPARLTFSSNPKVDVTINKILSLLRRTLRESVDHPDLLQHLHDHRRAQRQAPPDIPLDLSQTRDPPHAVLAWFEKELLTELTCEICFTLFYQPVTTPCQHTFCSRCLHRSLDHNSSCPLCRQDVPSFAYFGEHPCNKLVLSIILEAFPTLYAERGHTIEAEERNARLDTSIFIGELRFPGMPTLLHISEPRHRLMLRRCLQSSTPRFGIIIPPRTGSARMYDGEYGTLLEIRSVQLLPDGRSMVETWGTNRFRIMERGTLDGYMVARIEIVEDIAEEFDETPLTMTSAEATPPSRPLSRPLIPSSSSPSITPSPSSPSITPASPLRTNAELVTFCKDFLMKLSQGTAPWVVQRLSETYGPMPTDPSSFSFWVALILPIDPHEKAKLLPIRSAQLRLRLVAHWIERLNETWWFTAGCVIL